MELTLDFLGYMETGLLGSTSCYGSSFAPNPITYVGFNSPVG